jgi:hypothetical protein
VTSGVDHLYIWALRVVEKVKIRGRQTLNQGGEIEDTITHPTLSGASGETGTDGG